MAFVCLQFADLVFCGNYRNVFLCSSSIAKPLNVLLPATTEKEENPNYPLELEPEHETG